MAKAAQKAPPIERDMQKDLAAAAALKTHLRDILGDGLDTLTLRDAVEGETGLFDTVDAVIAQIAEDEARVEGIDAFAAKMAARKQRLANRAEHMRTLLLNTLDMLEEKRMERPLATVTLKQTAPKLAVIDESKVPVRFWKTPDPVLSKQDLGDALKARKAAFDALSADRQAGKIDDAQYTELAAKADADFPLIPGAELDNGSASVQIRFS